MRNLRYDCASEANSNTYCQLQGYHDSYGEQWQQRLREDVAGVDLVFREVHEVPHPEDLPLEDLSRFNKLALPLALIALEDRGLKLFEQRKAPKNELNPDSAVSQN